MHRPLPVPWWVIAPALGLALWNLVARLVFSMATIVVMGIPSVYYLVYRTITPFFGYFTHENIKLRGGLDRLLSLVFVTPDMHQFHHHYRERWTDSNFGNVF